MSKKILGLDLGTNSIGWALIECDFGDKSGKIADYASIPVVNSPRMGACGYEGGLLT